mmetsp:Transcript_85820/g.277979  ORF Transcript_85820/g.277979 Transcript_85820/m.277979 type:complete len:306 (+) Transcript_85820:126-1043(+)
MLMHWSYATRQAARCCIHIHASRRAVHESWMTAPSGYSAACGHVPTGAGGHSNAGDTATGHGAAMAGELGMDRWPDAGDAASIDGEIAGLVSIAGQAPPMALTGAVGAAAGAAAAATGELPKLVMPGTGGGAGATAADAAHAARVPSIAVAGELTTSQTCGRGPAAGVAGDGAGEAAFEVPAPCQGAAAGAGVACGIVGLPTPAGHCPAASTAVPKAAAELVPAAPPGQAVAARSAAATAGAENGGAAGPSSPAASGAGALSPVGGLVASGCAAELGTAADGATGEAPCTCKASAAAAGSKARGA